MICRKASERFEINRRGQMNRTIYGIDIFRLLLGFLACLEVVMSIELLLEYQREKMYVQIIDRRPFRQIDLITLCQVRIH